MLHKTLPKLSLRYCSCKGTSSFPSVVIKMREIRFKISNKMTESGVQNNDFNAVMKPMVMS